MTLQEAMAWLDKHGTPTMPTIGTHVHECVVVPSGVTLGTHIHVMPPSIAATQPASDTPEVGESWPKDTLHDAARQVVRGAKDLVPAARREVRGALDKAEAAPTGRAKSDGALGRALGSRMGAYGLHTGA